VTQDQPAIDLRPLRQLADACDALRHTGWLIDDSVGSLAIRKEPAKDAAAALTELARLVPYAVHVEVTGHRDGAALALRLVGDRLEVVGVPTGEARDLFDSRADIELARAAFDGDADAALKLPMRWSVSGTFDLAKAMDAEQRVRAALDPATVTAYITGTASADAGRVATPSGHNVFVALTGTSSVQLGSVVLAGARAPDPQLVLLPIETLDGEPAAQGISAAHLLRRPGTRAPAEWVAAAGHLEKLAAELVWMSLATSVDDRPSGRVLTFHGYKKASFPLPAHAAWTADRIDGALALREWAFRDPGPDRLLAIRQVVSLYGDEDVFAFARDVVASAEVVYVGLRTDAVAEAVKSTREAQAHAQDAARQAVKTSHDLVKAAAERMLAALVALGAVLIANASRTLPDDVSRNLLLLVAAFLVFLAALSALVEGPLLALVPSKLRADLSQTTLLTDTQRDRVDRMPSLESARARITIVRWVVPGAHLLFALLIAVFGHPSAHP
jgi:hypothetical protein